MLNESYSVKQQQQYYLNEIKNNYEDMIRRLSDIPDLDSDISLDTYLTDMYNNILMLEKCLNPDIM